MMTRDKRFEVADMRVPRRACCVIRNARVRNDMKATVTIRDVGERRNMTEIIDM